MTRPLQILLVEDSDNDAELILRQFQRYKPAIEWHRVQTEADFLTALGQHPDVIISDYILPQFSGLKAAELLRARQMDTPFILVSGSAGEEVAVEAMQRGASDYLLKNRLTRLPEAVERAMESKRRQDEHVAERRKLEADLRENEERFRQLAENIQEVFWMTDIPKTRMIYVSPGYEKIWGMPVNMLYASPQSWLLVIHPEDRERVAAAAANQTAGNYDEEYRILRPDGTIRWIRDRAFPVRDAAGNVYRLAGIAEDITERRQLEHQFRQVQKMEAIGQLAGGVAHDFNNLLTVIRSATELVLMDDQQLDGTTRDNLNMVVATTERAANLTRQLLTFSCKQVMQAQPLNLNEVIGEFLKMLLRIIGEDIRLVTQLAPDLPLCFADRSMLEQVVMNLVVNARDAMPQGGELTISTSVVEIASPLQHSHPDAQAGRYLCLTVADRGGGIPPGILPHIFEPFFTTKEGGRGTGLGLATVYGIVRQHRGWIEVASEAGLGASFQVHLPAMGLVSGVASKPVVMDSRGGNETILLVEDDAMVRGLTRNVLQRAGYQVLEAGSGKLALEIWRQEHQRIDIVLTDMVLPDGLSGRQLAEKLRADRPDLRIVYASGYSPEIFGNDFVMPFGSRFVRKPFTSGTLLSTIRECLDGEAEAELEPGAPG